MGARMQRIMSSLTDGMFDHVYVRFRYTVSATTFSSKEGKG